MASKTRRSRLAQANVNEDASIHSPKNVVPKTWRMSCHARNSHVVPNTEINSHSEVLENIFDSDHDTPTKKKEKTIRKKLNENEIFDELYMPDQKELLSARSKNSDIGKNDYKCSFVGDENSIKIKIQIEKTEFDVMIGDKEKTRSAKTSNDTSRTLRCTVGKLNYAEDDLMNKHMMDCINKIYSASPSRTHNSNKSQTTKQVAESSPRKRTKQNTQQQEFQQYDVDENEVCHTNQISSPPKRPKSETEIEQTPKKNFHLKDVKGTPRSAAKRKILVEPENVPSNSRMSTRSRKTIYGINYKDWSSSDDNMTKKVPRVRLNKLDETVKKKFNKQRSKNTHTSGSEESEIENKMHNANKNSTPRNTRSRSKSIQAPEEQMYSPTKDMKNLSINGEEPTLQKPSVLTPSGIQKSNMEKRYDTRGRSKKFEPKYYNILKDSDEESADSSENYEEENSDSEESSMDSGNDSAEEFQEFNKKKRNGKLQKKVPPTPKTHKRVTQVSMDTPTKAISRMSIGTPTLDKHRRTTSIRKPTTPLQKARATLHVSVLPKSLPCREEQFNDIYSFLHARLSDGSGGCIYISGVPGTGKTATVSEVICCLKKSITKGELSDFDFIEINGMKLSEPRQAYVQIWKQMTGETKTWEESHKLLQNKFNKSNSKRKMTLLLVDELDLLCTKRQDVVYNLLDWPSKTNAKLVVVTIANTMDLPERILMGKVTSRLGLTRLTFPPYNFKQLEKIVVSRLKGANAFGGETIQLVARKVAAVSGDARRALDICRRSAEIAEKNGREQVSMIDVKQALDEMIASPKIQAIKHCSDMEKYFLQAVCTEVQRTGVEEVVFKNVYMQMETLCSLDGLKAPNISEALEICARLGSWRLLLCDHSRMDIHQRLLLNVSTDDVYFATKEIKE